MTRVRISPTKRAEIVRNCDERCHLCGGSIRMGEAWDVEHVIPLAMGGADDVTNWRPAHVKCHKSKTIRDLIELGRAKRRERAHMGIKSGPKFKGWRLFDGTIKWARERH